MLSTKQVYIAGTAALIGNQENVSVHMAKAARGAPVKVAVLGISDSGKSTLTNALFSVAAGTYMRVSDAGAGYGVNQQRSLVMRTHPLIETAVDDVPQGVGSFEYHLMDTVGHRSLGELAMTLSGRVRSGELYPEATDLDRMGQLTGRMVGAADAVSCGMVLVPANLIDSVADDQPPPQYVLDAITASRQYTANTKSNHVLPLVLVITKVDEWQGATGHGPEILLQRDGVLTPLLKKVAKWGFQGNLTLATGFLDQGAIDYADAGDLRVVALKHLLVLTSRTARLFQHEVGN